MINLEINNCGDIGKYAFQNCLKLENVTIKNCGNIGSYAFGNFMYLSGWGVDESIKTVVLKTVERLEIMLWCIACFGKRKN